MEETSVVLDNMLDEVPKIQAAIAAYQEGLNALWALVDDAIDAKDPRPDERKVWLRWRLGWIVQEHARLTTTTIKVAALIERVVEEFEEIDFS